jgi:gentisate 1,2-dioxygenase
MKEGDLILTPPMCWHGHINESDHRIIWFDAANMPLIRAVDAHFFEPGDVRNNAFWQVDQGDENLWTESGLRAEGAAASAVNSPKYRYPGEATRRLLAAAPPGPDGMRVIRYVNPATGGAVMPTLDCYAARLSNNTPTRSKRATYNVICLVVAGEGRSTIGEQTFEWSQHDVFTIPHWTFARHEAKGGDADLFMVTDKSAFEALDLVREEME